MYKFKEDEKLLLLSSIFEDDDAIEMLKNIQYKNLSEDRLLNSLKGDNNKIRSLFIYNVRKYNLYEKMPVGIQNYIKIEEKGIRNDFVRKKDELVSIVKQMNDAGHDFILLKGLGMAETVYAKQPYVRDFNDIDILVCRDKADEVYSLFLDKMGYTCTKSVAEQLIYKTHFQHYAPISRNRIYVEMHHRLTQRDDPYTINEKRIMQKAEEIGLEDVRIKIPNNIDMLISLCYHLFQHEYREARFMLKPYSDIYNFLYHYKDSFDWSDFLGKVEEDGLLFPITYSLYFTNELFENCFGKRIVPECILQVLESKQFHLMKDAIVSRHLFNKDEPIGIWTYTHTERVFLDTKTVRRELCKQFFFYYSEQNWRRECQEIGAEFCENFEFSPRIWEKYGRI